MKQILKTLHGVLLGFTLSACSDGSTPQHESNEYSIDGVKVNVSYRFIRKHSEYVDLPLSNAVDGDRNTVWIPKGEAVITWAVEREKLCGADLAFVFSPPIYIKEIAIAGGSPANVNSSRNARRPKNIWVHAYPDGNLLFEPLFGDGFSFELANHSGFQAIPFDKGMYASMLRVGAVTISIMDCHKSGTNIPVAIGEIKFIFAKAPTLKQRMTLTSIQQRIKKDPRFVTTANGWYIKSDLANPDPIVNEVLSSLISQSISGNKDSESLLYTYSPPGTYSSEYQSHLIDWYKRSKSTVPREQ